MKNLIFIIISAFLLPEAFSQSNIRFENRKNEGYYNITQVSLLMGRPPSNNEVNTLNLNDFNFTPSITMINGIMFNERWAAGIGVGVEMFERNLFPFFLDVRHSLRDNDASPFFAIKIGYSTGFKKHYDHLTLTYVPLSINDAHFNQHGFMFNPEMGVKIPLSENADLLFTVAYRHQQIKSVVTKQVNRMQQKDEFKANMNLLSFGVAIMFR